MQTSHLDRLRELLAKYPKVTLYPCIADLAENSVDPSRFEPEIRRPCRQDVTQYLASWFSSAGISREDCQTWLTEFSADVLSRISSSSVSAIRHSTKATVKWVYTTSRAFRCDKEKNGFRAHCLPTCPNYNQVIEEPAPGDRAASLPTQGVSVARQSYGGRVKMRYTEQFAKATELMRQLKATGVGLAQIAQRLNEQGFKTRTGRSWNGPLISHELRATERTQPAPTQPETAFVDETADGDGRQGQPV